MSELAAPWATLPETGLVQANVHDWHSSPSWREAPEAPEGIPRQQFEAHRGPMATASSAQSRIQRTAELVRAHLDNAATDWMRLETLASQVGLPQFYVEAAIKLLGNEVRNPVGARDEELTHYRLSARGLTWGERLRVFKSRIGRYPLG